MKIIGFCILFVISFAHAQTVSVVNNFAGLHDALEDNERLLFNGSFLPETPSRQNQSIHGLQVGAQFVVNEPITITGFMVRVNQGSDMADRNFGYRIWQFKDGEDGEEPSPFEIGGNQPYGSDGVATTSTGSLAFGNLIPYDGPINNGDTIVVRLAEPVTVPAEEGVRYGFSVFSNDEGVRIGRGNNPNPPLVNGFEQLGSGVWRSTGGGGNRIPDFEVIATTEVLEHDVETEDEEEAVEEEDHADEEYGE